MMQNFHPHVAGGNRVVGLGGDLVCADVALDNHSQGRGYSNVPFVSASSRGGSLTPSVIRSKSIVGLIQNLSGWDPGVVLMVAGDAGLPFQSIIVPGMNGGAALRVADALVYDDGTFSGIAYTQFWWFAVSGAIVNGRVIFR